MSKEKPRKRAESLAVENVKRIADTLRTERNDALALAQIKRQQADTFRGLLETAKNVIETLLDKVDGEDLKNAKTCLNEIDGALKDNQ